MHVHAHVHARTHAHTHTHTIKKNTSHDKLVLNTDPVNYCLTLSREHWEDVIKM